MPAQCRPPGVRRRARRRRHVDVPRVPRHPDGTRPRREEPRRRRVLRARRVEPLGRRGADGRLGERQQVRAARRAPRRRRSSSPTSCPLVLAVVGVVIQAQTMSLQGIVYAQQRGAIFGWRALGQPFILTQFVGFALFLVAAQAELTQTPFDMPVAESELVAGYMVEYTGFRFLFFFIGEFGTAFAFAGHRRDALPRRLGHPRAHRHVGATSRTRRLVRQAHGGRLLHVLGALHLPALPGGPAAGRRLEVPDPHRARQPAAHRRRSRWPF